MKRLGPQHGAALMAFMLLLLLGTGVFLLNFMTDKAFEKQKRLKTEKALLAAKTALIAYAVSDETRPGELPCPDNDNDGKINGVGGNCSSIRGWLPWFRLGLGDIRDSDGERLWYAVSNSFRPYGSVPPGVSLNPDTQTDIVINGVDPTVPYVAAVIIAPGKSLSVNETNRTLSEGDIADDMVASYLEDSNSDGEHRTYTQQPASDDFNDIVMIITVDEIMRHVSARVKQEVVNEIKRYRSTNGFYPYAESSPSGQCNGTSTQTQGYLQRTRIVTCQYADVFALSDWFAENDWHRMFWFAFDPSCGFGAGPCAGNMTVSLTNNVESLVLYGDKAIGSVSNSCGAAYSQTGNRPSDDPCDYFDDADNYNDLDADFTKPTDSATSNDELVIISP